MYLVEGLWSTWGAWSSCSGNQVTRSRTRSHSGGVLPCSGINTESEPCCVNPTLTVTYQQYYTCCTPSYLGSNVLTDHVPESDTKQFWLGNSHAYPQKIRIAFSCAKMISSVTMRNSNYFNFADTKGFEIKVKEPNSNVWQSFTSGTLPNPHGQSTAPLTTFSGASVTVDEVEFACLSSWGASYCALNYLEFN